MTYDISWIKGFHWSNICYHRHKSSNIVVGPNVFPPARVFHRDESFYKNPRNQFLYISVQVFRTKICDWSEMALIVGNKNKTTYSQWRRKWAWLKNIKYSLAFLTCWRSGSECHAHSFCWKERRHTDETPTFIQLTACRLGPYELIDQG